TDLAWSMVTVQNPPIGGHAPPLQPTNTESGAGTTRSCTSVPGAYEYEQVTGAPGTPLHIALGGDTLTEPTPPSIPSAVTVRVGRVPNVAVTCVGRATLTLQAPVPVQAPDQPVKTTSGAKWGVRPTDVVEPYE